MTRVGSRTAMSSILLDTRSFTKPNAFSGLDAYWQSFQFVFASYLGLLHDTYDDLLEFAEKQTAPLQLDTFSDDAKMLAKQLYHMLVMYKGPRGDHHPEHGAAQRLRGLAQVEGRVRAPAAWTLGDDA